MKIFARDIIILHICTKNHNKWCKVLEIQSKTNKIFYHYGPFFALLLPPPYWSQKSKFWRKKMKKKMPGDIILLWIHVYHKWKSYDIWFVKCKVRQTKFFVILGHSFPFSPLTTWKIKILTLKKYLERLSFYTFAPQMAVIWCTVPEKCSATDIISCHSGPFFSLLPRMDPENQNFKNEKTSEDIIILQMCTIDDSHMMYGSWDMECNRQNFLSFWTVFWPFTHLTTWKIKILKVWKTAWRYYHFTQV